MASSPASEPPPKTADGPTISLSSGSDAQCQKQLEQVMMSAAGASPAPSPEVEGVDKWPGWPGYNVFRLLVPALKVGGIIGRKGDVVKKLSEETRARARIRVLEGPIGTADRIVLISGQEDPNAELSPAMDAVLRFFKHVSGLPPIEGDDTGSVAALAFCSVRLLVPYAQATHLIGKQGTTIKSVQERCGASIQVLSEGEALSYATPDERIVEIHADGLKVLKALEAILCLLRKFLVDHTVVPIFEKIYNATISQDCAVESWADKIQSSIHPASGPAPPAGIGSSFSVSLKQDPLLECESQVDPKLSHSSSPFYGQSAALGGMHSTGFGRPAAPMITEMSKTLQVPLSYAEDIIGMAGANIAYIRRSSGAILTVQESGGLPDEITVDIRGTSSQVQTAEQLIQECINSRKEPAPSIYGGIDNGLSSYSHLTDAYSSPSFPSKPIENYGCSRVRGYSSFRF